MNVFQNKKLMRHDGSNGIVPVWVRPVDIKGMIAVNNRKQTRITFYRRDPILVEGGIAHVLNELTKEEHHYNG